MANFSPVAELKFRCDYLTNFSSVFITPKPAFSPSPRPSCFIENTTAAHAPVQFSAQAKN